MWMRLQEGLFLKQTKEINYPNLLMYSYSFSVIKNLKKNIS